MKRHSTRSERGAALVEFAVVLPLFVVLVFGIMESGWLFAQQVELRNATREGARLAVVDYGDAPTIITETCNRADLSGPGTTFSITINADSVTVDAVKPYKSLTGFVPAFSALTIRSFTEMRTERTLSNLTANGSQQCSP
jgi:Flp pilus assembly protein TadG